MAIASQYLRSAETVEDGRKAIEQRLFALGRAHDLLLKAKWKSAHLREILNKAIEPFDSDQAGSTFKVRTLRLLLPPRAAWNDDQ
jgi:two-component sensor histidine kinase